MAVQQNRVSKQKKRQRKAANRYQGIQSSACPSCGEARIPHRACPHCGNYRGRQVLSVTAE